MSEPVSPPPPLAAEDVRAIAVTTAQTGPPALAAIARHYLDTRFPSPVDTGELSEREEHVVRQIARGYSNKEIGVKMAVSVKTVETYKARAMEKIGVKTRMAMVRYAARRGWLNPDAPDWV